MSDLKYCFGNKEAFWYEEFEADKYSALNNNIGDCLSYLKISKVLYNRDIKYNSKNHPPIGERIRRIEKLRTKLNLH